MQPISIRFTPYHLPHSTQVKGVMIILGGDDRWLNNLFLAPTTAGSGLTVEDENADLAKAGGDASPFGLACYDEWPTPDDDWIPRGGVPAYAEARLPVTIDGNAFAPGTHPGRHGGSIQETDVSWSLNHSDASTTLTIAGLATLAQETTLANTALGFGFQSECPFDDPLGELIDWQAGDCCGHARDDVTAPGPFTLPDQASYTWPGL